MRQGRFDPAWTTVSGSDVYYLSTGANTYTGGTTIKVGGLLVNGSALGPMSVLSGAVLGGSGSVGTTTVAGTLSPGSSIGTITVSGNLTFGTGSTYLVELSPTPADRTNVTGTATLGGLVQVIGAPGVYAPGTLYPAFLISAGLHGQLKRTW